MKHLEKIGLAAVAAMAMAACTAGNASATTLEVNGVTQNSSVAITASLVPGSSLLLQPTGGGAIANTCADSHLHVATASPYSGHEVGGPVTIMTLSECNKEGIEVVKMGELRITHLAGTTNGTVNSVGAQIKISSPIGQLNCRTGTGTDIGTLTGKAGSQHAILDINAVINCGFLLPSAELKGEYIVTSPTGLGVSA